MNRVHKRGLVRGIGAAALAAAALIGVTATQAQADTQTRTGPVRVDKAQAESDELGLIRSCRAATSASGTVNQVTGGWQAVVVCTWDDLQHSTSENIPT